MIGNIATGIIVFGEDLEAILILGIGVLGEVSGKMRLRPRKGAGIPECDGRGQQSLHKNTSFRGDCST
jgi:hypothetical protein